MPKTRYRRLPPSPHHRVVMIAELSHGGRTIRAERPTTPHNPVGDTKPYPVDDTALVTCWCERSFVRVPWPLIRVCHTFPCGRPNCHPPKDTTP